MTLRERQHRTVVVHPQKDIESVHLPIYNVLALPNWWHKEVLLQHVYQKLRNQQTTTPACFE